MADDPGESLFCRDFGSIRKYGSSDAVENNRTDFKEAFCRWSPLLHLRPKMLTNSSCSEFESYLRREARIWSAISPSRYGRHWRCYRRSCCQVLRENAT